MDDIRGATTIVTGASRGLGVYMAKALADRGANLVLTARSADELERVRVEIAARGGKVIAVPVMSPTPTIEPR
jgi:short-subunit dehydrogenase